MLLLLPRAHHMFLARVQPAAQQRDGEEGPPVTGAASSCHPARAGVMMTGTQNALDVDFVGS